MKHITTIKGPAKTYKTAMLILVANEEVKKGREVKYATGDEREEALRRRGLDERVTVRVLTDSSDKDRLGRVTSVDPAAPKDTHVWRIRQVKKEK